MSSELERRLGKVEDAIAPPNESTLRRTVEQFEALARAEGIALPADLPTDPHARGNAIFDTMFFHLTGCHRPHGPDPVSIATEEDDE